MFIDIFFQISDDIALYVHSCEMAEDLEIRALGREHPYPAYCAEIGYQLEFRSIEGPDLSISFYKGFVNPDAILIGLGCRIAKRRYIHDEPTAAACVEIEKCDFSAIGDMKVRGVEIAVADAGGQIIQGYSFKFNRELCNNIVELLEVFSALLQKRLDGMK